MAEPLRGAELGTLNLELGILVAATTFLKLIQEIKLAPRARERSGRRDARRSTKKPRQLNGAAFENASLEKLISS